MLLCVRASVCVRVASQILHKQNINGILNGFIKSECSKLIYSILYTHLRYVVYGRWLTSIDYFVFLDAVSLYLRKCVCMCVCVFVHYLFLDDAKRGLSYEHEHWTTTVNNFRQVKNQSKHKHWYFFAFITKNMRSFLSFFFPPVEFKIHNYGHWLE